LITILENLFTIMKDKLKHQLKRITNDNTSGSKELLQKLHFVLKEYINEVDSELTESLKKDFDSFQSIKSYLNDLQQAINDSAVKDFFESFDKYYGSLYDAVYDNFKEELKKAKKFLTIYNSNTLFEILKRFADDNKNIEIIISEGRPVNEGRILAEKLSETDIKVTLITEAQIYQYMQNIDTVIIGADKILPGGSVINKVGSNTLAVLAEYFGKHFYVISDNSKRSDETGFDESEKDVSEIWKDKPDNIKVTNKYFEVVQKDFITKIITD